MTLVVVSMGVTLADLQWVTNAHLLVMAVPSGSISRVHRPLAWGLPADSSPSVGYRN